MAAAAAVVSLPSTDGVANSFGCACGVGGRGSLLFAMLVGRDSGRNAALRPLNSAKTPIQIAFSSAVVLACIWVCTCMCMYACIHTRTYMHACTLGLLYLHAFAYARACACTHPSTMSAIFLTLCLCMCGHNTRSLALRKHFWLKLDPTSLQDFSLSDLHHACRHEVREGYEDGQEACSRLRMQ